MQTTDTKAKIFEKLISELKLRIFKKLKFIEHATVLRLVDDRPRKKSS